MDNAIIDEIRRSNDIVEVINSYQPLKRVGTNWRGVCPFHNDTHPSLYVSQPKQIFKCFACGKAGNVFTYVQDYEHLTFFETVKKLAQRAGIAIPEREKTRTVSTQRDQLLQVYKSAKEHFCANLFQHGKAAREYLKDRQFSPETAQALELGYALDSQKGLVNHLLKEGYGTDLLKSSGLFSLVGGNLIDQFRHRLMFPIHNHVGEVVAFGGRTLSGEKELTKYINSPGTEIYTKGKELYGLFKTKYEIGKADKAIICEGYFDFLRLFEAGIAGCVATLGTALTDDQIYLLARYANDIYMLYDGDKAGQKAAVRAALLVLSKGLMPQIVSLPEDQDPDTYLIEMGKDAMLERIQAARNLPDYMAENEALDIPKAEKIAQLIDAVRNVRDGISRREWIKNIAEAFKVNENSLLSKLKLSSSQPTGTTRSHTLEGYIEERYVIILAMKDKNCYKVLADRLTEDYFFNGEYRRIFKYLCEKDRVNEINEPAKLLADIEQKTELNERIAELLFAELPDMRFEDTLNQVIVRKLEHDIEKLDAKIKETHDPKLLKQKQVLMRKYRQMTKAVITTPLYDNQD
ncbi:MAG: DNA primase [Candidatus Cloacimonetes bacterium]|nr:DNA primase [Candidatus Cloacimonadota bacterium]